jgi:hypothetical protein
MVPDGPLPCSEEPTNPEPDKARTHPRTICNIILTFTHRSPKVQFSVEKLEGENMGILVHHKKCAYSWQVYKILINSYNPSNSLAHFKRSSAIVSTKWLETRKFCDIYARNLKWWPITIFGNCLMNFVSAVTSRWVVMLNILWGRNSNLLQSDCHYVAW